MTTSPRLRKGTKQKVQKEGGSPKTQSTISSTSTKIVGVLVSMILVVAYFIVNKQGNNDALVTFSPADIPSDQLVSIVKCSNDYKTETFSECKPKHCGRIVMDNLVSEDEANHLLGIAKKGLAYGGSSGGASILDLHSGALSKNNKFINIYSATASEPVFTEADFTVYREVKNKIHQAISSYFNIPKSKLYLTKPTFFSRMNTTEAKTLHDEYWHPHIDRVTYGSFHYTSLLYLSTYGQEFTGGRFIFVDKDSNKTVEPRLGRVSFFTSGSENLHFVEKLESGTRYAITISFTCDPAQAILDPQVK